MPKVFTDEQENKIKTFINLALDFNKTHNIFSRESYNEVYENDVLDCKPLIKHIKKNENVLKRTIYSILRYLYSICNTIDSSTLFYSICSASVLSHVEQK
mgnify:CR=1 FL=1